MNDSLPQSPALHRTSYKVDFYIVANIHLLIKQMKKCEMTFYNIVIPHFRIVKIAESELISG